MYNHYYNFQEKPFSLTPDPHFLYLSTVHKRALAYLTYGLEDKKGFITITGEIGAGKTTIIQALIKQLDTNTTVARVINTKVSSLQLLKLIVRDFGIGVGAEGKEDLLEKLNQFLLEEYSYGHNVVIIIDEAQNLEPPTLEEIRLLSNLETEKDKLLQIILVGQPELREILALPKLKQLRQRITVGYHISSLSDKEVGEYIRHRLAVAGAKEREIFTPQAMKEIYQASGGIPRLINIICDAALVTGYVEECQQISDKLVKGVISELEIDAIRGYPEPAAQKSTATASLPDQDKNELPYEKGELYAKYQFQLEWEKRLSDKQNELNVKQEELYQKLDQLIHLERKLIVREEMIKKREMELDLSVNTEVVS